MSTNLSLVLVPGKGKGLVTNCSITRGQVLTRDLCVELSESDWQRLTETALWRYVFFHPDGESVQRFFCFGISAFANHSADPNVEKCFDEDALGVWLTLRAQRDIAANEELCIRYAAPELFGL
jgi:hypothetical protein